MQCAIGADISGGSEGRGVGELPADRGERVPVKSCYKLEGDGGYGFAVGSYDPRYPLIIDPELDYSTFLGGTDGDGGGRIAVGGRGRAYVTGFTNSADYPTTPGAFDTSFNGDTDAFVTKLPSG